MIYYYYYYYCFFSALHRLDRLTSGLLLFGKTISKVQDIEEEIRERKVKKEYLALVNGEFNK